MSELIIVLLVVLWVLGYINIPGINIPNPVLFNINDTSVSFVDVLVFGLILWTLEILPNPLRQVAFVLLVLWVLSVLGIVAIASFPSIIIIALIVALLFSRK